MSADANANRVGEEQTTTMNKSTDDGSPSSYVLSTAQMREIDRQLVAKSGLPSLILMENAGRGVAEAILSRYPLPAHGAPWVAAIVCGPGNNGGDGFVIARHLAQAGVKVRVLLAARPEKLTGDAAAMFGALRVLEHVQLCQLGSTTDVSVWGHELGGADIVVDALFGTGLGRAVDGIPAAAIAAMNDAQGIRVAVDVPSGLDGDTAQPHGASVRAHITITIGARKIGLVIDPDAGVGELVVVGLGLPIAPDPALGPFCHWTDEAAVRPSLPTRPGGAHKGTGGHLIVVAGSRGKTGAALLSARAALRTGAGLVTVASTAAAQAALDSKVVEVMTATFCDGDDAEIDSFERVSALGSGSNVRALVLGPGIPTGPGMRNLVERMTREIALPMVVDADGLNLLGPGAAAILAQARGPRIVTPHPGEMGRLSGLSTAQVQADRLTTARAFAASSRAVVVLKGARTLVAAPDGAVFVNPAVEPALATAGSGDVLTGVVGALLSQGMEPLAAARAAVYLHGCAGALAARRYGATGVVAGDLPEAVASVRAAWSPSSPARETR